MNTREPVRTLPQLAAVLRFQLLYSTTAVETPLKSQVLPVGEKPSETAEARVMRAREKGAPPIHRWCKVPARLAIPRGQLVQGLARHHVPDPGDWWPAWAPSSLLTRPVCVQLEKYPARSSLRGKEVPARPAHNVCESGNVAFGRLALFPSGHPHSAPLGKPAPSPATIPPGHIMARKPAVGRQGAMLYPFGVRFPNTLRAGH